MRSEGGSENAVTVVIPCHNGVEDTRACIATLLDQEGAPPLAIVVADNGSTDKTRWLDREIPGVRVVRLPDNLGFAGGANRGLGVVQTPLAMVLNNDTLASRSLVARLVRALRSDERIALTAPVSNHVKGPARLALGELGTTPEGRHEIEQALAAGCAGKLEDVETLSGLCLLMRRELIDQVGAFDESFGLGNYEDDDFCLRVRKKGRRLVIARDAFLHHLGHRTFQALEVDYKALLERQEALFRAKWRKDAAGACLLARLDGDWTMAEEHATRALAECASWPDAHLVLGRMLGARGELEHAASHLREFLRRCPAHGEATLLLALSMLQDGDETQGLAEVDRALRELWVDDATATNALAQVVRHLLQRKRHAPAADLAREGLALRKEHPELHNLLGVALLELGDLAAAEAAFTAADRLGAPDAKKNLGICRWRMGRIEDALVTMAEASRERPEDQEARANLEKALAAAREHARPSAGQLRQ